MLSFESDDFNIDSLLSELDEFEIDCPECGKKISISLNDVQSIILCPHCKSKIKVES